MASAPTRRDFLVLLGGAAGVALSPISSSSMASGQQRSSGPSAGVRSASPISTTPHAPITATRLSENLVEFTGAGGNVVVVTGPDGLVMINGGLRERSADLLKAIADY